MTPIFICLLPLDEFRFTSRRCEGFPFSLTIYVNRQCHVRLSTCCESKRTVGARLGQGFFQLLHIQGNHPCIRYLIVILPIPIILSIITVIIISYFPVLNNKNSINNNPLLPY